MHHLGELLHQAPIGIPGQARVAGQADEAVHVASHRPTLSSVSIMPGMDTGAPERTDTSSGLRGRRNSAARRLPAAQHLDQQVVQGVCDLPGA
jgi:hypothetical protein